MSCALDKTGPHFELGADTMRSNFQQSLSPIESHFLSIPSNRSAKASLQFITSKPHVAGTHGDYEMAKYMQQRLIEAGIPQVDIDPQKVLLSYPVNRSLDLIDLSGTIVASAGLSEDVLASDPTSGTWWRNVTNLLPVRVRVRVKVRVRVRVR